MTRIIPVFAIVLALAIAAPALAQEQPDLLSGEGLGLPELQINVSDDGWDAPAEIAAGRYLITASYEGERDFGTVAFLSLPSDWTIDGLNERLAEGDDSASPVASDGTGVSSTVDSLGWLYEVTLAGGVSPVDGGTAQGIVDLFPGSWAIWADAFTPAAIELTVTGEMPADLPEPASTVTVTGTSDGESFGFEIDGDIEPGTQVIKVVNASDQPHFLEVVQLSSLVTEEQLAEYLLAKPGGTPVADSDVPADLEVFLTPLYAATQSPGTTQWMVATVSPGAYAMVCWLPDPGHNGESHAQRGMITIFEVFA